MFLEQFYELIEYVKLHFKYFVIAGDFNVHMNKPNDPDMIKFNDLLHTFSLDQFVKSTTHKLGNKYT